MPKFWKPKAYKPQVIRIVFIYSYHYNFTHFIWSIIRPQTLVEDGMLVLLVVLQDTHLNHSFYIVVAILSCCELLPCCVACVLVRYYFIIIALQVAHWWLVMSMSIFWYHVLTIVIFLLLLVLLLLHHIANVAFNPLCCKCHGELLPFPKKKNSIFPFFCF